MLVAWAQGTSLSAFQRQESKGKSSKPRTLNPRSLILSLKAPSAAPEHPSALLLPAPRGLWMPGGCGMRCETRAPSGDGLLLQLILFGWLPVVLFVDMAMIMVYMLMMVLMTMMMLRLLSMMMMMMVMMRLLMMTIIAIIFRLVGCRFQLGRKASPLARERYLRLLSSLDYAPWPTQGS